MFVHNLDPVLFSIGPIAIRWYGLMYLIGFFVAGLWLEHRAKHLKLTREQAWDIAYACLAGVLIGGRLYETLVWSPQYYLANPIEILYIWRGGMAFHGGLIGSLIAAYYMARKLNIHFLDLVDTLTPPMAFTLGLGRIANFINGEIFGPPTNLPWCVVYKDVCRHPYQLYAAAKRFTIGAILLYMQQTKKRPRGALFFHMLWMYGLGRIILDNWREEYLVHMIAGFSVGQWSSAVMVLIGVTGLYYTYKKGF